MTFFNRKEEVLEIKLTPYGRYLLSTGELKPVYYSFFDDDITYDANYMSGKDSSKSHKEKQNDVEGRIKETPRVHCQTTLRERKPIESVYVHDEKNLQKQFEKDYMLSSVLGNADYYSDFAPSWDIDVLKGNISKIVTAYSGSGPVHMIPQIHMSSSLYQPIVGNTKLGSPVAFFDEDLREISEYGDNTFLEIRKDFLLLEIKEENATFVKENFEIELFEVDDFTEGSTASELLTPLKLTGPSGLNKEHYFNLDVDQEIDERILCKYKGVDSTKGLFLQGVFDCDLEDAQEFEMDQYQTSVTTEDICD